MAEPTSTIAHYRLGAKLGEGGMGQVYRATDTKLHRDVALKLLPEDFAADPERLERFRREARALAALSHPNIGAIHGIEEADGQVALVLELIEGPTLADRIEQGPLPLDEALPIARQIAAALEAAHERGIVHRDLKPANVKITPEGQVKVLDFGLAKSVERAGRGSGVTQSPTLMMTAATPGLVMGTAAYMSPEQAKGNPVDRRADIWAYGAVLFEMLSGRRLFDGNDLTEVLAAVISTAPDLSRLPRSVPPWLRDLIGRCLRRDVSMRLPDAAAARIALIEGSAAAAAASDTSPARPAPALVAAAAAVGMALGAMAVWWAGVQAAAPASPTTDTEVVFDPPPLPDAKPAVSPDGRLIAYTGGDDDSAIMIYIRNLGDGTTAPLPGSERGTSPEFSPDGRSIAFVGGGRLWVGAFGGSLPVPVTPASGNAQGMVWMPDDTIVFSTSGYRVPARIAASGGTATPLHVDAPDVDDLWVGYPSALPDPERLLVSVQSLGPEGSRIAVLSLRDGALDVLARGSNPTFVAPSSLVFVQRGGLVMAPFDPRSMTLTGPERALDLPGVTLVTVGDAAVAHVQTAGFALFPMGVPEARRLVWVDRQGTEAPTGFTFDGGARQTYSASGSIGAALSPDGRQVAMIADDAALVVDLDDVAKRRRLPKPGINIAYPRWDPSGENISLLGNQSGSYQGYLLSVSGAGQPQRISAVPQSIPLSFFPDGRSLLGYVITPAGRDLWVFGLDGTDTPFLQTQANERAPVVSPRGDAIAYVSDDSGADRIYLRRYPDVGQAWQISGDGATAPVWSRDGNEVFFLQGTQMMAVEVDLADGVRAGTPQPLFGVSAYEQDPFGIPMYDVAADGRFIVVRRGIGVRNWRWIQNWGTALTEAGATR